MREVDNFIFELCEMVQQRDSPESDCIVDNGDKWVKMAQCMEKSRQCSDLGILRGTTGWAHTPASSSCGQEDECVGVWLGEARYRLIQEIERK